MGLEWVKCNLLRKGTQSASAHRFLPQRRRGASSTVGSDVAGSAPAASSSLKQSAYVIAERMEPSGCSCLLVGHRRRQSFSSSPPAHQRCRVVLPGVAPGTVLRTRASVLEWIRKCRQLPASTEYSVLMKGGKRVARHAADMGLPALPCGMAATNACQRCPWMAVGVGGESATTKHANWRASLHSAVRKAVGSLTSADGAAGIRRTHDDVMRCCSFSEPFSVAVTPNRLLGLQLFFLPVESTESPPSSRSDLANSSMPSHGTPPADRAAVRIEREGLSSPLSVTSQVCHGESTPSVAASGGSKGLYHTGLNFTQECLLESLEQKRLVSAFERWAAHLPISTQASLLGVFISQPFTSGPHLATMTALQVILAVERNTDVLGMHSPLCGPSHPVDLLSTEEQQLVEVITAAAPLVHEVEVLVWIQDACNEAQRTTAGETALHRLYPAVCRNASLEELQCETWRGRTDSARDEAEVHEVQRGSASQAVRCWCHAWSREISVSVSPYHAAISAVSSRWWSEARRRRSLSGGISANSATSSPALSTRSAAGNGVQTSAGGCSRRLPWVPTFWRHPGALDACCSVLFSLILEDMTFPIGETSVVAGSGALPRPESIEVHAPALSERALVSTGAHVGAGAGQTVLDGAVVALAREARRLAASSRESEGTGHLFSSAGLFSPTSSSSVSSPTPRRVLVSVRGGDGTAKGLPTTFVEEVLRSARAQPVRLCFYECTLSMNASALATQASAAILHAQRIGLRVSVNTGIVDVDPLASSYVAYACVSLRL
ncbi:hypothetical protein JKF63_02713 [Porcisia hertigi]|uniref:Uncharacterized protein n=1 Tax=Porcisia hertigi TaxID=2761500 RepID=A0A836HNM4_9TRYP|nr:hypothetical protein JKF63_02713 [Porcisia hertigi]